MRSRTHATTFHTGAITLAAAILGASGLAAAADCDPHWDNAIGQPGMNNTVYALTVFDAGPGSGGGQALYAGGFFTTAGSASASTIAKWNGTAWSPLDSGMSGPDPLAVVALAVFDDAPGSPALYAGGAFTEAGGVTVNRIAKWDGDAWSALGSGMNNQVTALTAFDDAPGSGGPALYAAGLFITAGGVSANRVAKWDGTVWSALGSGMNNWVHAVAAFDDGSGTGPALYAGGDFTTAGGVTVNRIAKWDGTTWSPLGSGVNARVSALKVFDDGSGGSPSLYAAGEFTTAGGGPANRIAKWDGTTWSALGDGVGSTGVRALAVFDDGSGSGPSLYAGGTFTTAGGIGANNLAKWDGTAWSAVGSGMNDWVLSLAVFDDGSCGGSALYTGGTFTTAGGMSANRIVKWVVPKPSAPGDLNCDGHVGVADLLLLLQAWGPCADPDDCPADVDGDGSVGVADLLILLSNWGPACQ